ncbi:nucleoside triphosphate hydrolase [Duganella sp. FT134W]|uniref:Nucleoside triphosphate hydrolase n=1 Tax=Duganella margarita TaxID=2692170 RepID=A0A7X4GZ10_9BURK|nr:nucleoside triphosphate hydrolase [Duganella margarita]MYM71644.1 nucleoside triphosphate hydrolase [Duganella margarita]
MSKIIHATFGKNTSSSSIDRRPHTFFSNTQRISNPNGGWEPVGFDEHGHYVILSRKTGQLVTLCPRSLDGNTLRAVVGSEYCDKHYGEHDSNVEKSVFNPSVLAAAIRKECDELGRFDPTKTRGPGFYCEAGTLLVHFGNEVYESSGGPIDTTPHEAVYVSGPGLGFSFDTPVATAEEVQQLETVVRGFNFQSSFGSVAVLGWLATAVFGSVVDNRPILAVTAERGSGKTTLLELLSGLLGPQAFRRDGIPTVAQVIYELENRSAALLVDEFEAQGARKKPLEDFLSLVRTSFTKSKDARIARVIAGRMRFFNPPAGVMVAGIALPTFDDAANTRTVRIQMQMLPAEERRASNPLLDSSNREAVEELGARIRRMLISRWEILVAVQKAVRGMLFDLGHEARAADLYSPLIAGYIALTSAELPSQQRLEALLEECQLTKVEVKAIQRDSDVCLSLLLNRRVVIFESDGEKQSRTPQRIRDVIWRIMDENLDIGMRQALIRQLEKFGLRPLWKPTASEWKLVVATSEMNTGLRRLLQGTPWSLGGLKDVLLRLPGASIGQQRVDGMSQKVVELCFSKELVKPDVNGDYELPDAA